MTTNYDIIAEDYKKAADHPIKQYIESYTILKVLGNIEAKSVLDLACGEGYYTRLVKQQGAGQVIGVDISVAMINQAKAAELAAPLGIEYRVQDVTQLGQIGEFDMVTAIYLFPYAATKQTLIAMFQVIFDNLKPGGKLVSITLNPGLSAENSSIYGQYGVQMATEGVLQDGATIKFTIDIPNVPNGCFELSTTYWDQETHEHTAQQVGFQEIIWHPLQVSQEGLNEYGEGHWQAFIAKPYGIILECYK
jgi:2-polyprenyl-3-methyl-5-hydroxy-6-metoxy-1,4-benzoquinol methylase